MTPYFESIIGFDPDGIRRIYASTWIEARQEARSYIRNRPDTAPLSAWRFDLVKTPSKMLNKTEQSDCAPNANEKQEDCYCSALPKGSPCLPCYTRWLAGSPRGWPSAPPGQLST